MNHRASLMPTGAFPFAPEIREIKSRSPICWRGPGTLEGLFRRSRQRPRTSHLERSGGTRLSGCILTAFTILLGTTLSNAALSFNTGYSGTNHITHSNADGIISYDWGSDGNIYYATATGSYGFGGLFKNDGITTTTVSPTTSDFAGASVVAIGSSIFFNDGNFPQSGIHQYSVSNSMEGTATVATHYSLGTDGSNLFLTGASGIGADNYINCYVGGVLTGTSIPLANTGGASGPIAFDTDGNLFYATGYGDLTIYRWSAAEVADAVSSGGASPLAGAGHIWLDYSGYFQNPMMQDLYAGATSMVVDGNGNVIVSLTNFAEDSGIIKFDASGTGSHQFILTSNTRVGELRVHDGGLFLSDGNQIVSVIPEPSTSITVLVACLSGLLIRRRNS